MNCPENNKQVESSKNVLYTQTHGNSGPAMASHVTVMSEEEKQLVKKLRKVEKRSGKDEAYDSANENM